VLDVLFDGRRVWSFWTQRDTERTRRRPRRRTVPWPAPLRRHLDGTTRVTVTAHVGGDVLHDAERRFGTGEGRIEVVNGKGVPLAIDKAGRLQPTFDNRSDHQVTPLLDSVEEVLGALSGAGVEAFPAYGTLLGAVRDGDFIGHDSDADVGYVSRHTHPVDVIRESFDLQRSMRDLGYPVTRYSGAGFKVEVTEADGTRRGLDVFGGFFDDSDEETRLVLLGEVRAPFERSWVFPLGTTTLAGRTLPAPAEPGHLLEAMYGPGWKTPDPAFKFETPATTTRRLDDWFRGTVVGRAAWDRRYQSQRFKRPADRPTPFHRSVYREEQMAERPPGLVVDVGCGRGSDARWFARQDVPALGLDYSPRAYELVQRTVRPRLPLEFGALNLLELRSVLGWGARVVATGSGPRVLTGRHIVDAVPRAGREHLWRFLRMACTGADGGRAHLQFLTSPAAGDPWAKRQRLHPVDPDRVREELARHGDPEIVATSLRSEGPGSSRELCRMVVEWAP
jgi:hypothetical protein